MTRIRRLGFQAAILGVAVVAALAYAARDADQPESTSAHWIDGDFVPAAEIEDRRYSGDILMKLAKRGFEKHTSVDRIRFESDLTDYERRVAIFYEVGGDFRSHYKVVLYDERDPTIPMPISPECACNGSHKLSKGGATVIAALKGNDDALVWRPEGTIDVPKDDFESIQVRVPHWSGVFWKPLQGEKWEYQTTNCNPYAE